MRLKMVAPVEPQQVIEGARFETGGRLDRSERLIERGKLPDAISLIVRGKVRFTKDGRILGDLGPGDLVGSALILSGIPSNVEAVTAEPLRAMRWQLETLQKYLGANPETRTVMQRHLAHDLALKIGRLVTDSKRSDNIA